MIRTELDLLRAQEALGDLYRALAALRTEIGETNARAFALVAEGPLNQIARIQAEIDVYTGAATAKHEQAPLWLRLIGPKARWGETRASVLTAFLDALRKGLQAIVAYNTTGRPLRRPTLEVQSACDIEIVDFAPGSFQIGVRLPEPEQAELFAHGVSLGADKALGEFIFVTQWAATSSSVHELSSRFPDTTKRRVVLRAVKPFIPRSQGGIDYIELSGSAVSDHGAVQVSPAATNAISSALETAVSIHEERFEGDIREMDLDKQTFRLRHVVDVNEVRCHFGEDIYPLAAELLGKRVRLIGTRPISPDGVPGVLEVVDLEKVEIASPKK